MSIFGNSVKEYLSAQGFHFRNEAPEALHLPDGMEMLQVISSDGKTSRSIMLLSHIAENPEMAEDHSDAAWKATEMVKDAEGIMPLILTEDRWNRTGITSRERLLAHMEIFFSIYARNCEVRRIDKQTAAEFLERTHSYGDASCKYRYGLFLKRHTGHIAASLAAKESSYHHSHQSDRNGEAIQDICPGTLVAVATFSNARKWIKGDKVIRSYEWTRYASLPGLRVNGGMGKLLKAFIKDVKPDDIMSYADLEWSEGKVYEQLGFKLEGHKDPVCFRIDTGTWQRSVHRANKTKATEEMTPEQTAEVFFRNFGSAKYRLKLTEYE